MISKANLNLIDSEIEGVKALYFFLVSITYMSLLSKSEIQYLRGHKQVSRSYEYKLKSIIKKKVANLMSKDIPLVSKLFPEINLTEFGKVTSPFKATIPGSNPGRSIAT